MVTIAIVIYEARDSFLSYYLCIMVLTWVFTSGNVNVTFVELLCIIQMRKYFKESGLSLFMHN